MLKTTADRSKTKSSLLRFAVLALLVGGVPAMAQSDDGSAPSTHDATGSDTTTTEPAPPEATTPAEPKAPEPTRRDEDLFKDESGRDVPVSQYIPLSDQSLQEMRKELTDALSTLKSARDAKDAVRLNCVNDKITAMKGILRISEDAFISLQEAASSNANDKARYEFGKIKVARMRMGKLSADASNCAGAEATYTGGAEVVLEEDQELLGTDPYYGYGDFFASPEDYIVGGDQTLPGDNSPIDARPPPASPFQGD
jgi:hypothetical protein